MASITEILQLCRLCLVKEQVNVPIFEEQGDIRQIFLKITACLPVKISREDKLPKKICSGCLYKLELLYQFWNTSTNAEKQLLSWLSAAGMDANTQTTQDAMAVVTQTQVVLKQEPETTENVTVVSDPDNFILQAATQPIEFPAVDFDYQENFSTAEQELANNSINAAADDSSESEPLAKRARRAATSTVTAPLIESEDDDADDPGEAVAAKTEEDSDDDTNMEPTFVDVAEDQDDEQPGPSGLGKIVEPPSTSLRCEPCNKSYKNISTFKAHMKIHMRGEPTPHEGLQCDICSKTYKNRQTLRAHLSLHMYKCNKCPELFAEALECVIHQMKHFNDGVLRCIFCPYTTKSLDKMTPHLKEKHQNKFKYVCKLCNKGFNVQTHFAEHDNYHTGEKPFVCNICDKAFMYSRYLLAHQKFHKGQKRFKCEVCGNQYVHKRGLTLHMNVHTGETMICDICGKQLSNKDKLKLHQRIHTGYKPYQCCYCPKKFTTRPILVEHERIHTGEKPYKCDYCEKCFSQRSSMIIHMRGHIGEKPFTCHICEKGFVAKSILNMHLKNCKGYPNL